MLGEGELFGDELVVADIDIKHLAHDRRRMTSFEPKSDGYSVVGFALDPVETALTRKPDRNPFVPAVRSELDRRAEDILRIQTAGLKGRMANYVLREYQIFRLDLS